MKRLRTLFVSILMLIVGCGAAVLSACGENNDNMTISLSASQLEIVLGENDNTGTIYATVQNATDNAVSVQYDSQSIQVSVGRPSSDGVSEITVTALRACQNVEVVVNGVAKSTAFTVTATLPVTAITPNQTTYAMSYDAALGGTFELSQNLFTISPEGTSQTGLIFNPVDTIEGVTIENNILTIQPGLSDIPESITVEVVSAHRDNVRTNITIDVINAIDVDSVEIVDQSGARLDSIEISRTNTSNSIISIYVRVPYSVTTQKLNIVPQFAYNDKGIVLDDTLSYPVDSGSYYEYVFNFTLMAENSSLGQDTIWFLLSYENYPDIVYSTANSQNGRVIINVIDEIRDISITNNQIPVDISGPINLYTTYSTGNIEGYALTFTAVPATATNDQLSLNISAADQNYVIVRDGRGNIIQFTNNQYLFDSGETFYFIARSGFTLNDTIEVTVRSERENVDIEKNITFTLLEGVTSLGFVNSAGDGVLSTREFYLDTDEYSSYLVQVAVAPTSIDLTDANVVEIYSTSDAFSVGQIINTNQTLNGATIYTVEIIANNSGTGELVISFVSGQQVRATVNVIDNLNDVRIGIDPNFSTSTAVGNLVYEDYSLVYVALKNGQSLPLTFTGNTDIESIAFNFVDYVYDENNDDVYDENGAYVTFGNNRPTDEAFTNNNSNVISANYLRSLSYLSPITVGKVWIRATFTGKQIIEEDNGEYIYTDIQISRYILVEIYNPIISIEIDAKEVSLYAADELGQGDTSLSEQVITLTVNRGTLLPTYNLLEIEGMTDAGNGLYQYFIPGGVVNFEIEKLNDYQFLVRALSRNDDGTDGIGETEFESTIINFVSRDLNLDRNEYSISATISMEKPQLVEEVVIGNVSSDGIYLMTPNLTDDIGLTSFKLAVNALPANALNRDVVYRFIPDSGTLSSILSISNDGLITTTGTVGGSGKIRVIPKDSVFTDENGHEYYRDGYVYAEVDILVADGRSRETALRISDFSDMTDANLHYVLLNDVTYSGAEQLFGTFTGGLYGSVEANASSVATITMNNSSNLFGTLSANAVIEDLIVVGNVNATSMLVDTNTGTIRNVTVDVFTDENGIRSSGVTYSQGNAGGIVQTNTGLIENVTFVGNISANGTVGGIAAVNNGQIIDSKVLFYNLQNDTTTKFEGFVVGMIAGELTGNGIIRRSYAYNFSADSVSSSNSVGAIVGIISGVQTRIDQSFGDVGDVGESGGFYAQLGEGVDENLSSIISDSYTITKSIDGQILFTYYMTNNLNRTISGHYSSTDTQNYPNVGMNTSSAIWYNQDVEANYGFPYINNVRPVSAITSEDLASLGITQSRLSLAENGDEQNGYEAVMFVYRASGVNLTSREQQLLTLINTISYGDLFGTYLLGGLIVTSSNNNVISTTSNGLVVKNIGTTTLTISSRYDYSVGTRQVTVNVIYYTSELTLSYNGQTLGESSNINIRTRVNETLSSSLTSTVTLVDRQIPLMQNNFAVRFVNENDENATYVIGSILGTHTIVADFEGESVTLQVYLDLEGLSENNRQSLKDYTQKTITLQKIYGPVSLVSSVNSATISASDELTVVVEVTSDTKYLDTLEGNELVINFFDSDGETTTDVIYSGDQEFTEVVNDNGTTTRRYTLTFSLDKTLSSFDSNYTIVFTTNSPSEYDDIRATLALTVLEQEILRVDVNHYAYRGVDNNQEGVSLYNYYPNNVLSPGTTGLLDVMVYPSYANYTHVTVTSEAQNGQALSFLNMRKAGQGYRVNLANTFAYITNGIEIYKVAGSEEVARYYVRVRVPENVEVDTVYTINITVYNGDEVMYTLPYSLIIVPQERAGITVDGQSSIYAIRGETITADVVWDQTQNIRAIEAFDGVISDTNPAVDVTLPSSISDADREEYATSYYRASIDITIGENSGNFRVRVSTSRTINGVEEIVYSYLTIYVIDFELDFTNTHIANEDGSDVATGDQYFYNTLEFNFGGRYIENSDGSLSYSENAYNAFVENNHYQNGDYEINTEGVEFDSEKYPSLVGKYNLLYNLYYVNGNAYTPVSTGRPSDAIVEFIVDSNGDIRFKGTQNGTQRMMLQMRVQMPDLTMYTYSYFFDIVISDPTSDDSPAQISNAEEFMDAINGETEEDYILTSDIYLYNYTPVTDTSMIRSLDGNGYQIIIVGFNYDNTQSQINLSLFNTVSSNTTLKNLRVNVFHVGTIDIRSAFTTTVNVAPIAITNNGIITNCEVVSFRELSNEIAPRVNGINVTVDSTIGVSATTAGFVITNNGIITNSRVGGEEVVEYNYDIVNIDGGYVNTGAVIPSTHILSPFVISSFGEIAGFVYQNSGNGHIVSSYASNMRIINNSNIDYTTITSGFVINNTGLISASYSKGVKQNETDVHAALYGIETSGISAGFVYENSGEINNSYSNITLTNQNDNPGRNSAGFVYRNTATGVIETSLSLSRIIGSTTTQMNFAGVDDYGNYQNLGEINNSYYYDEVSLSDSSILIESAYGEGATYISNITLEDYLYGFSFADTTSENADDGIWVMTNVGPELVSANQIAVSLRYASQTSPDTRPIFTYVDEYQYGSKNNPILIRSAEEFARVFSGTDNSSASRYVNTDLGEIFGSYRLINDIDLSELVTDTNNTYTLASSSMTLTGKYMNQGDGGSIGKFDGNGLTINGLALADPDREAVNFGLFASITDGAIVQNVNLVLGSTNAGGDVFGVEASGVEYVGALAGTVENSKVINVNLTSLYSDSNSVTVRGRNVVGGLIGRVIGDSYIFNLSATDISVTASMNPANYSGSSYISYNTYNRTSDLLNTNVSYAGGVVGVIDVYTESSINIVTYADSEISADGNAIMLKTIGTNIISGGTVGGVVGYVGALTVLQDALYELSYVESTQYSQQGLYSYNGFAGGVVGYNGGYIRQVRSEHEKIWQIGDSDPNDEGDDSIEANIKNYYNGDYTVDRGNTTLFQTTGYTPIAIGGLVGIAVSGKIEKSYSKLNVINTHTNGTNDIYAGGIIGLTESPSSTEYVGTTMIEVYASGDVQSRFASGIVGFARANMRLEKVNAINYWGNWLINGTTNGTAYAIAYTEGDVTITGTSNIMALEEDAIKFVTSQADGTSETTPNGRFINNTTITNVSSLPSLKDTISGVGDDGELFDVYFTGNDWDRNSWSRDDNELYPHIVFGYSSNIHYIRDQGDIELLRTANAGDVFVIAPDAPDPDDEENANTTKDGVQYIGITKHITPITTFSGMLRGLDNRSRYGFLFIGSEANQTRALFLNTVGATFSNFTIAHDGASFASVGIGQNAVLVANATNTTFTDLTFTNINAEINSSTSRFGLVTGLARGSTTFDNIEIYNSDITLDGEANSTLNLGLVFGDSNLTNGGVYRVTIKGSSIDFNDPENSDGNSINVGLVGGRLASTSTTTININASSKEDSEGISGSSINFTSETTEATNVYGINMGTLFGRADNAVILSNGLYVNLTAQNVNFSSSSIGGLIGYAQNCTFEQIDTSVLINVTAQSSNIGGIVGYALNCNFDTSTDIDVNKLINEEDEENFGINVTNISTDTNTTSNNIGGVFGAISGGTLQRIITTNETVNYRHAVQSTVDITVSGNTAQVSIGGIAGLLNSGATLTGAESYGDISLRETFGNDSYNIRVGGIVGTINNRGKITYCYSFGDVKHIIANQKDTNNDYSNVSLVMSGIVAYISGVEEINVTTTLQNNVSTGNFYPSYQESTQSNKADTKSAQTTLASLTYGGLIGVSASNLNVTDNISIATLFNGFERDIVVYTEGEDNPWLYNANALAGTVHSSSNGFNFESNTNFTNNYYAHVATLCTDANYGTNVAFNSILNGLDGNITLQDGIRTILDLDDSDYAEILYNGETKGTKLNPRYDIPTGEPDTTQYVYLGSGSNIQNLNIFEEINNTIILSDGYEIVFNEGSNDSPFGTIDKNSSISGIVVIANYRDDDQDNEIAGFAMQNDGIIYSCNVKGGSNKIEDTEDLQNQTTSANPTKRVGTLSSNGPIAGLVGENNGLIKDTYVSVDIETTYEGSSTNPAFTGIPDDNENQTVQNSDKQDVAVAGLVGTNGGRIVNSYSSGTIDAENAVGEKGSSLYVYLVSAGNVYDSYTNMRVVYEEDIVYSNMEDKYHIQAFGSSDNDIYKVIDSYYDKVAAEFLITGGGTSAETDKLSLNYSQTTTDGQTEQLEPSISIGTFNYDVTQAYGYGSFSGDEYANIDYMQYFTGDGLSANPYQVPNLGKLRQLDYVKNGGKNASTLYFNLINDINASYISTDGWQEWQSLSIANISLDGYDTKSGEGAHTISNLNTRGGGLFDNVSNSTLSNIIIDNFKFTINVSDTIVGLLANNVSSKSTVYGITITDIDPLLYDGFDGNSDRTYYYGNVVGQLGEGSIISDCMISGTSSSDSSVTLQIGFPAQAFVYGGIVGLVVDGATISDCNIDQNFVIEFIQELTNLSQNTAFVVGGVVGLLQEGTVTDSYLSSTMYVLSHYMYSENAHNTEPSSNTINLYTGGIVGASGEVATQDSTIMISNSDSGTIQNSGLYSNAKIFAGNPYNITKSYVGGISGYGGNIENCYNSATFVVGSAKYTFNTEPANATHVDFTRQDKVTTTNTPNIYTNYGSSGYEQYDKLVYMRISQDAYVAGIANSYDSVNQVVNNCTNISGGLDARRMYAHYDVDTSVFGWIPWSTTGFANMAYIGAGMIGAGLASLPWGWLLVIPGTAMVVGGLFGLYNELTRPVTVNVYHFNDDILDGMKFDESTVPSIYDESGSSWESFVTGIANIFPGGFGAGVSNLFYLGTAPTLNFTTFNPDYRYPITSAFKQIGDLNQFGLGLTEDNYVYNQADNGAGDRNLYVYNVHSHSIGSPKQEGASTSNVAWREGVYEAKNIAGTTLYKFDTYKKDNGVYGYLWDTSEKVISSLDEVDGKSNSWSPSMNWDGWEDVDGDYVPSDSPEIASTSDIDMFNNNITISEEDATAKIRVNSLEDYRGAVNIVNGILGDDTDDYTIEGIESTDAKFTGLKTAIKGGNVTISLGGEFINNNGISFNNASVQGFGVDEDHPFSGTITSSSNYNPATINGFFASNSNSSVGLVAYGKNVTIERLNVTYKEQRVLSEGETNKNVGGLIGTVVSDGNVTINNSSITMTISDQSADERNSTQVLNLGGLIGSVENNSIINISRTDVTLSTALTGTNASNQGTVGGLVGSMTNSTVNITRQVNIALVNSNGDGILSTSSNTIVGGAIGRMENSSISTQDGASSADLTIAGFVDVENTTGSNVYAGGLVGYFTGSGNIDLTTININLSSISATAGVTNTATYAAGVIGYMVNNATTLPISIDTELNVGSQGSKLIITSGLGGTEYSEYAYADNFVGNRASGYSWNGTVTTNTSVLAMAKPSYEPPVDNDTIKPTIDPISSKQVSGTIGESVFSGGGQSTSSVSYFKVDSYEYATQVDTYIENAFINGDNATIYNYQKNIYIILTYGSIAKDAYKGQDVHNIQESIYRLTINGYRMDINEISDVVTSQTLEFVTAYTFATTSDIYYNHIKNGTPIPMSDRGNNFVPVGITILVVSDNSISESKGSVQSSNGYGEPVINGNETNVQINETIESSTTIASGESISPDDIPEDFDPNDPGSLGGIFGGDNKPTTSVTESITYNNITLYSDGKLALNFTGDPSKNQIDIYTPKGGIIYDYGQDSIGANLITNKFIDGNGNNFDLSTIKNTESSELYIKLPNGRHEIDNGTYSQDTASINVQTTVSKIMRVDGDSNRTYRLIFISVNNGFAEAQTLEGTEYQEYIYLVDNQKHIYYLGDISYVVRDEITFESGTNDNPGTPRNAMFFPTDVNILSYQNNLLPLNKIQEVTSFKQINISDIVATDIKTSYYIDATSADTLNSINGEITTTKTTYTIKLDNININSLDNIDVNFVVSSTVETSDTTTSGAGSAYIRKENGTTVTYTIENRNVYMYDDLENPLSAVVLTSTSGSGNSQESTTTIYVFTYDTNNNNTLTGFTVYESGFELRTEQNVTYYVILQDASGTEYDSSGKNEIVVNTDNTDDENDYGVSYATVGGNTLITFTNGNTSGYMQLAGTGYEITYNTTDNTLTVTLNNETYTFSFQNGKFVLSSYTHEVIGVDGEVYTITETYTSDTSASITIEYNGNEKTINITTGFTYFVASTDVNGPTIISNNFVYNIENWWVKENSEVGYELETPGYIEICEQGNETPIAIFERTTLNALTKYTATSNNVEAEVYVYDDNNIVIFVNQNAMWTLFKSGQDVYKDLGDQIDFDSIALTTTPSGVIALQIDSLYYDISNGYIFDTNAGVIEGTANSAYSDETLSYSQYYYNPTFVNDEQLSYTKIEWDELKSEDDDKDFVELDIGVDSVSLIPFNSDYAIQFTGGATSRYYTRSGYEITGIPDSNGESTTPIVGQEINLSGYSSMGVNVPTGVYVLANNAQFTTAWGETITVKEYVYVRHNVTGNWWSALSTSTTASFTYEQTYEGETAEVTDTISRSRGNVTQSGDTVTFSETINTESNGQSTSVTYNWSFDASENLVQYYSADSLVESPDTKYNRYDELGYSSWNTTNNKNFNDHFANTVIVISRGGAKTKLDVVFGVLEYEIQEDETQG